MTPRKLDGFEPELHALQRQGLHRRLRVVGGATGPTVMLDGVGEVLLLGSNNYLGLATHPRLIAAAQEAAAQYGTGSGASRLVSGTLALHERLEHRLATFEGSERAIVFGSGYQANIGVIPALAGDGDLIFSDARNHASIIDGCRLSRARSIVYPHLDVEALETRIKQILPHQGRRLIVTESLFSMDGDVAPLGDLVAIAERYDCLLVIDEAHAIGVFGPQGQGLIAERGLAGRVHLRIGTLSKALGGFGGFVTGSASLIDWIVNRARSFIFSTAPSPPALGAALAALDLLEDDNTLRPRLWRNVAHLRNGLEAIGIVLPPAPSQIIPVIVGDAHAAVACSEALLAHHVWVQAIRPPTVPHGSSRLRTSVSASHTPEHIEQALNAFGSLVDRGLLPLLSSQLADGEER